MDKHELLSKMQAAHASLETLLSGLTTAQKSTPGVYGESSGMTVKDVLAHIAAWERMEAGWLRASLLGKPVTRYAPGYEIGPDNSDDEQEAVMHALNDHIFEQNKARPFDVVLAAYRATHADLLTVVQSIPNDTLNDPQGFAWWSGEPIWHSIAGNSYDHIQEHIDLINSWLSDSTRTEGDHPRS